jgi:hypothetical protein
MDNVTVVSIETEAELEGLRRAGRVFAHTIVVTVGRPA